MRSLSILFLLIAIATTLQAQSVFVRQGVIDLRQWNFKEQGNVHLNGEWGFYMSQLIPPDSFPAISNVQDYIYFPSTWNESSKSLQPGKGYATYHLTVLLSKPQQLTLEVPHFYSSYALWINKKLTSSNGIVGRSKETSIPQWLPKTVSIPVSDDTLDIVIHASNYRHAKGGVRQSIIIGLHENLNFKRNVAVNSNIILIVLLGCLSGAFLFTYIFYKRNITSIYFSLLCFTWAIRAIFSNLYILTVKYPEIPWELCVKIEYITLYLAMVWAVFFLSSLFPEDVNTLFKYFFIGCNIIFVLCTVFTEASLYTQFLPVYLSFTLVLLLYSIYVLVRAVVYEREGVWYIVSSVMLGISVFTYDLIAYQGWAFFNSIITNFGYAVIFILLSMCLLYHIGMLKRTVPSQDILTFDDLYGGKPSQKNVM
ncbi:7TM diverse intracellular signaling domain-containing protein [Chryseosolibacter indicus]|uniref:7TM-DISM domain-containing protein n=1 Tax=Chryseosolibacter indicus TaxID=2782351 RepID=A0ABS5VRB7_9BACT|nr:7TM diverse intracellular signaling domain-containing protein [Chryseosolibacter indicus]MBT1702556.1 7TM-DISM domain-containing protein [Chryseosolibacter indicus]